MEALAAVSPGAYNLLSQRTTADNSAFYVYQSADSAFNHGFPSGVFGNAQQSISFNTACVDDPTAAQGCSTSANAFDPSGNAVQIVFAPLASGQFVGLDFEEPQGYVSSLAGTGYNLTGATSIQFSVRSPTGITLQFGANGQTTDFVTIPASTTYSTVCIGLQGGLAADCPANADIQLTMPDFFQSSVHLLFTVVTNNPMASAGGTVLLRNIQYIPAPPRSVQSLPLSTASFAVVPAQQQPIPPDQANRNPAAIYEASLTVLAFLLRGQPADIANAEAIGNALVYALGHDNSGDPLPVATDGSTGLHSAYEAGDLTLLNSQGANAGQAGQIRIAGFTATNNNCGTSNFCLVQDGATGGNNAFAVLALVALFNKTGNQTYLTAALTIGNWVYDQLLDTSGTGYGGYFAGYPDAGPKTLETGKSTENNSDIFAAFTALAQAEAALGNSSSSATWTARAKTAGDFVIAMFNASTGCFYAGTAPANAAGNGIQLTNIQRGNDVINDYPFLDNDTFTYLAMARSVQYGNAVPWSSVVSCLGQFASSAVADNTTFNGYSLTTAPLSGANGVAWEFTGQAATVIEQSGGNASSIIAGIATAQTTAPYGDGQGLVAATLVAGDTLPPLNQCLSTPFQCIPERVGIAATAWAIFAENAYNPFTSLFQSSPLVAAVLPASRSATLGETVTAFATIINAGTTGGLSCGIAPINAPPLNFHYQATNPTTNQVTGTLDAPVNIAGSSPGSPGSQSFVIALTPSTAFAPDSLPFSFGCGNIPSAPSEPGVNTLLVSASATPVPDIVALAASGDPGHVDIAGPTGAGDFAVATVNLGAAATITASANTGSATLPVSLTLCQTNPTSGACLATPSSTVTTTIAANATPTFGIFVQGSGSVADSPGANRVFVTFTDAGGAVRGETSVAVRTQ